jgi:alkanesulfonate monooxygenase SsuD/methylene tetrahydromethanopterin reductase-like flavin-dependent oxidoreductase (luciferase family)
VPSSEALAKETGDSAGPGAEVKDVDCARRQHPVDRLAPRGRAGAVGGVGDRFDRLEDTLEIIVRLSTGNVVSYNGHHFSLREASMRPVPVQRPHPPIWIGGSGLRRTLPLAARYADVWHTYGSPEKLAELSARLDRLADEAGRDPAAIGRASSLSLSEPDADVRANIERLADSGFGYLVCGWPNEGRSRVEAFARTVMVDYTD